MRAELLLPLNAMGQTVSQQFEALAEHWKAETAFLSSTSAMVAHPAYQAIIALGRPIVPFLLRDLEQRSTHWFEALAAITGASPVPREHEGRIAAMKGDWLAWGREQGLL